jgi:hypothetical protein
MRHEFRMSRLSVLLAAIVSLLFCSVAFGQTGATDGRTSPGSATGAALPGMPTMGTRPTQTGTARIRGRIVAAQSGTPLRRAQVTAARTLPTNRSISPARSRSLS